MADDVMVAPGGETGLSQVERVVDTFIAPSKTFTDILRSSNWLLPFIIMLVVTIGVAVTVDHKIGYRNVAEQQLSKNQMQAERINAMPPDQRDKAMQASATFTKIVFGYGISGPILIFVAFWSLLLWATFKFALGAEIKYGQVFAVIMYSGMPKLFISLLAIVLLLAGVGTENFDPQSPVGTSLGYYMTSPTLKAAGSFFDIFDLWSLVLLVIGMAIVARKSRGQSAAIVVGWWLLGLLISAGMAAAFS